MGFDILKAVKDFASNLAGFQTGPVSGVGGTFNGKKAQSGLNAAKPNGEIKDLLPKGYTEDLTNFLVVNPKDWYKIFPYQFEITVKQDSGDWVYTYTLPIPPDGLTTKMAMASEATPTMSGVVEETSMNKIWMISLTGTTGMAVARGGEEWKDTKIAANKFRKALSTTGLLAGLESNVKSLASKGAGLFNAGSSVVGAVNGGNPAAIAGTISNSIQALLEPSLPYANSAIDKNSNGYSEIARLQKFLFMYTVLHEKNPGQCSLTFRNIKDAQVFRCVVKDFTVAKSVQEPYLYRYKIQLKCWDPQGNDATAQSQEINRFDPQKGDLKTVNTLTLTGMYALGTSEMGKIASIPSTSVPGII